MKVPVPPSEVSKHGVVFRPDLPVLDIKIKEAIKRKRLTYREVSKKIGLSRQSLDNYNRGTLQPTVEVALKLSLLLEMPVEELFSLREGAWYDTAKDDEGYTIFYDHLTESLLSGDAMKGARKSQRFDRRFRENMSSAKFNEIVKEAEKRAVEEAIEKDGRHAHNRDTLAKVKQKVRENLEEQYPLRYEQMYIKIPEL